MVSMRFARNLADGHGLVYNAGQPAVEGYTNLLWTLWMAVLHLAPVPIRFVPLLVSITGAGLLHGRRGAHRCDRTPARARRTGSCRRSRCGPSRSTTPSSSGRCGASSPD